MERRYWLRYRGAQYNQWRVVDVTYFPSLVLPDSRRDFGTTPFDLWINLPTDDPRHFQLGAVITPRAVLGI